MFSPSTMDAMGFLAVLVTVGTLLSVHSQGYAQEKARVMVLGTYHMDNPGRDLVKSKIKDVLSRERQTEILEVVEGLKKFHPNKIALEAVDDKALNERYQRYLAGSYDLTRDEREQIGFRLAKELGLKSLCAVDSKLDMDFDKPMGFYAQHDKAKLDHIMGQVGKVGPLLEKLDQSFTVGQILAINNSDSFIRMGQSFYMDMLSANDGHDFPGADMLGDWYKRNLRIFCRLQSVTQPGDRVLMLFGSGHVKYLRDIIQDSDSMTFVSPLKYLPKVPASARDLISACIKA